MNGRTRVAALVLALLLLPWPLAGPASAADGPAVTLSTSHAGTGDSVTVSGSGWPARTLLMLLVCGRATPARGLVGGTNSCANADGRAVTTDATGHFSRRLPVADPPDPCPCVVHVATATGTGKQADAVFEVAGHAIEPLPAETGTGRLTALTDTRLQGADGLLTWFGAPPARKLVLTVGNPGTATVKDPVFQVGTAHGVFAPEWDEHQWRGTIGPGERARVELPVELSAGAHGDYTVSLKYGGKVLAGHAWDVGRPWGVTLFWILLCLIVPAAVFRIGMAIVDHVRPAPHGGRDRSGGRDRPGGRDRSGGRGKRGRGEKQPPVATSATTSAATATPTAATATATSTTLPWFTPDTAPIPTADRLSAPHDEPPAHPTTPGRKGTM